MKPHEPIYDYASFLKAKYALKEEIAQEQRLMREELKQGFHSINPLNFISGITDRFFDSGIIRKVTNVLSLFAFVKDLFRKKQNNASTEE